jgi:hypothetical protein
LPLLCNANRQATVTCTIWGLATVVPKGALQKHWDGLDSSLSFHKKNSPAILLICNDVGSRSREGAMTSMTLK